MYQLTTARQITSTLLLVLLSLLTTFNSYGQPSCAELDISVSSSSLTSVQLFSALFFLTPQPEANQNLWTVTDMDGNIIHQELTTGSFNDQSFTTFMHSVPTDQVMDVTLNVTNPLSGINCTVVNQLTWVNSIENWNFTMLGNGAGSWPSVMAEVIEVISPTCPGDNDGSISIMATAGAPLYAFSIDGGPFLLGESTFDNLSAGVYEIKVRDRTDDEVTLTVEVPEANPIVLDIETYDASCHNGSNGQIVVSAAGGTGTLIYYINNDGPFTSGVFADLPAGTYDIVVEDQNACFAQEIASVGEPEPTNVSTRGTVVSSTNPVLPAAYNFQEYVFAEPDDQGTCQGIQNASAEIAEIFLSQTHRHAIGHPLLFTISERPVLLQVAVTGVGAAPDVQVEGTLDDTSLGTLCLSGPAAIQPTINTDVPNLCDYFTVTVPKAWIKEGLQLTVTAGNDSRSLVEDDLQITPYTELNLVLVNMDVMDYNQEPHRTPIFDNFLEELASAIPASVVRFGIYPETVEMPDLALNDDNGNTLVLNAAVMVGASGIDDGYINLAASDLLEKMQQATGDIPNTIYFGNTLNLAPGGWGGDGAFVSFDYTDIFIHELGHALSLPHWADQYRVANPSPDQYSYPYAGETGEAGGRGSAWNFNQDLYDFVSPICQDSTGQVGTERSDAMQREFPCVETRTNGPGPWDGFGDFSAKAINNFLVGSNSEFGQVEDRGEIIDFHLKENEGYPLVTLVDGKRQYSRTASQPQNTSIVDQIKLPGEESIEEEVYLIYGSAHATLPAANIIYEPIRYTGTLLPTLDPTDNSVLDQLRGLTAADAPDLVDQTRDITLKLNYIDGSVRHVLVPFHSFERPSTGAPDELLDVAYFSIVVPADTLLCGVELYHRDFVIGADGDNTLGNINDNSQGITGDNFMNNARLMTVLDHSCNCPGTPGYVVAGTPCDDGNPATENDVEDGFCNCAGTPIGGCGLLSNTSFAGSLTGWWSWGLTATTDDEGAMIDNISIGDAGIAQGPLALAMDQSYTISFTASAAQERTMDVVLYLDEEPFTEYYREAVMLTSTEEFYEIPVSFSATSTEAAAIEFFMGDDESSIFLNDVCLEISCAGNVEIPYNGIDDDCDPETLDDDLDQDGFPLADDCDDNNPDINPDADEVTYNGIDDDCDPETLDDDLDQDGFLLVDDCDDNNPDINPDAEEVTYNGIDDDCDPETLDDDLDQDGFLLADDCDDNNPDINPDADEVTYNGIDDDCDPETLDDDLDQDGFPLADDCDDNNPDINPDAEEVTYNGIDDDCDPETLDDDLDQDGFLLADDCDDNNPDINPDAEEIPNNGIDENCDGEDLITSTKELLPATIKVYPNPTSDVINIVVGGKDSQLADYNVEVYDLYGRIVLSQRGQSVLQVNDLTPGTYLLVLRHEQTGKRLIEKIIKSR